MSEKSLSGEPKMGFVRKIFFVVFFFSAFAFADVVDDLLIQKDLLVQGNAEFKKGILLGDAVTFKDGTKQYTAATGTGVLVVEGEWYGGLPVSVPSVTKIVFDVDSGFYITETALGEILVTLGSHWHTLYLDDGGAYAPSGQQNLQIRVNPDPLVEGTSMDTNTVPWTLFIPKGGSGGAYTNQSQTAISVGGIPSGSVLGGKSQWDIFDELFYPELWPVLTAPSRTFTLNAAGLQEAGSEISLVFTTVFNRGGISPSYGTDGFRSGVATNFVFSYSNVEEPYRLINENTPNTRTNIQTFNNYRVALGLQRWNGGNIFYEAGMQPLGSKGTPTNTPLPAGSLAAISRDITGVYPYFATTIDISVLTKQPLQLHGSVIVIDFVSESSSEKQTIDVPSAWGSVTNIAQWNPYTSSYDSMNIDNFSISATIRRINEDDISYDRYVWRLSSIGQRRVRFMF